MLHEEVAMKILGELSFEELFAQLRFVAYVKNGAE